MPVNRNLLSRLLLYRRLKTDPVLQLVEELLDSLNEDLCINQDLYYDIAHHLLNFAEQESISGSLWKNYLLSLVIRDENIFSLASEKGKLRPDADIWTLAIHDLTILQELYRLDWMAIEQAIAIDSAVISRDYQVLTNQLSGFSDRYQQGLKQLGQAFAAGKNPAELAALLSALYGESACGKLARYTAFTWENGLQPIPHPDPVQMEDLIGYAYQKELLQKNTEAFLKGRPANHVLLYGEKGTGKSSSIKAILNRYADQGLRMIELNKQQLSAFNQVIDFVAQRGLYFIIFIDDLSFEDFETDYKHIKASIDGSLAAIPANLLIYVSSNRRHLIRENWSDRQNRDEEIHAFDSVQEKLSFADRFGISLTYSAPDQDEYLHMVEELAARNGLSLTKEKLHRQALQWERRQHGRSGRSARQFIHYLQSGIEL